jgi:hypothetical protein
LITLQQSGTWIALCIFAAAALLFVTDVQVMSYAQVPAVPTYRDCTPGITLDPNANLKLENARLRAITFINAATTALSNAPDPGSLYEIALNRHFVAPTAADRATIAAKYREILPTLKVQNYICNTPNICAINHYAAWGGLATSWNDDLIHVCRAFFDPTLVTNCRAIILIHEGAHDEGIDAIVGVAGGGGVGDHAPYRGQDPDAAGPRPISYPFGNTAPPAGETTANRMDNPSAYGYFAAHIWRNTDTAHYCS